MPFEFNIDTDEIVAFTNKLETLHRSSLPNAVRETLNGMAFDVKSNTMLKSAKKEFIERDKNFFKANSRVKKAFGFDLETMNSKVGFIASGSVKNNKNSQSIENLKQQESGGTIKDRAFLPTKQARTSRASNKKVRRKNRLRAMKGIIDATKMSGATRQQKFNQAFSMSKKGGFILADTGKKKILWEVVNKKKNKKGLPRLKAIYTFEDGRNVKISKATKFMQKASEQSAKLGSQIFIKEAKFQFEKHLQR